MTAKRAAKSIGAALIYLGIYFVWQVIVVFAAMFAVSMVLSFGAGADMAQQIIESGTENYYEEIFDASQALGEEIVYKSSEWMMAHAAHLTVLAGVLTLITYAVIFKLRGKNPISEVELRKIPLYGAAAMVLLGAALNFAVSLVLSLIPFPEAWWGEHAAQSEAILGTELWVTVLLSVVVAPILEEVVFRGLVYTRLKRCMPMFAAMIISSWLFGLMHGSSIALIYATALGLLLSWVHEKYKSIAASILVHVGFNTAALVVSEVDELPTLVCIMGVLISAALITMVQLTSKNKIGFTFPVAEHESNHSENK